MSESESVSRVLCAVSLAGEWVRQLLQHSDPGILDHHLRHIIHICVYIERGCVIYGVWCMREFMYA